MIANSIHNISERKLLLRVVDIIILLSSLFFSSFFIDFNYFTDFGLFSLKWILLLLLYYLIFGEIFLLYDLNVSNNRFNIVRSIILTALFTTIFYIFTPYITTSLPGNRIQIIYLFLIISFPVIIWRYLYMCLICSPKYFKNIVLIGKSDKIKNLLTRIKNDNIHNVNGYLSDKKVIGIDNFYDITKVNLSSFINKNAVLEVIVSLDGLSSEITDSVNKELILLFGEGIHIISYESFYEEVTSRIPKAYLKNNFYNYINYSKNNYSRFYLLAIRFLDLTIYLLGIGIFLILIPFIFLGNLVANRGSLFYSQQRIGLNGKPFKIYKLRSMIKNAELNGAVWSKKNDPRITPFGKFLRNTRFDEFPQFFNILKGDMSIIGPRPERLKFIKKLEEIIHFYSIRNTIRPGLTGWAQVKYHYANTIKDQEIKLRYDLYYIKERNAFLDFKILIKTFTTILFFIGK